MNTPEPIVSAVIVNRNRKGCLRDCLESIHAQDFKDIEVIVVDNMSEDGSIEMVEQHFPSVILIKNLENLGPSHAKNQAINLAKGEYLWFLDNDSLALREDVLSACLQIIASDNGIGGVGGEAWVEDGVEKGFINRIVLGNGEIVYENVPADDRLMEQDYFSTANLLIRKDMAEEIGGFNNLFYYLYEDTDICYRVKRKGYRLAANKKSMLYHRQIQDKARITNYYRLNKTRLIFIILEKGLLYFFALPLIDLLYLFHPLKLKVLKAKTGQKDGNGVNPITLICNYFKGSLHAYLWAYGNLGKILWSKRQNFLKNNVPIIN